MYTACHENRTDRVGHKCFWVVHVLSCNRYPIWICFIPNKTVAQMSMPTEHCLNLAVRLGQEVHQFGVIVVTVFYRIFASFRTLTHTQMASTMATVTNIGSPQK